MSFSFYARGATKAAALEDAAAKMADVVASQPVHALDADAVAAVAAAYLELLPDVPDKDVTLSVGGSVGWTGLQGGDDFALTSVAVNVSASFADRV